jgi:hypothetical protein
LVYCPPIPKQYQVSFLLWNNVILLGSFSYYLIPFWMIISMILIFWSALHFQIPMSPQLPFIFPRFHFNYCLSSDNIEVPKQCLTYVIDFEKK